MINVSESTKSAYQKDTVPKRMYVTLDETDFTNEQIYYESFELTESIMGEDCELVGCISSQMKIKLMIADQRIRESQYAGMPISVSVRIIEGRDESGAEVLGEEIKLFAGCVNEAKKDADRKWIDIVAYDELAFQGDNLVYKCYKKLFKDLGDSKKQVTVEEFRRYITHYGMDIKEAYVVLPNDNVKIKKRYKNKDVTGMDILKHICQGNGCFGIINRDGEIDYKFISQSEEAVFDIDYYRSLTYGESYIALVSNGITMRTNENDAGVTDVWNPESDNYYQKWLPDDATWEDDTQDKYLVNDDDEDITKSSYVIEGNLIAYKLSRKKKRAMLANIMRRIGQDIVFREYSVTCNGFPFIECGDKVRFTTTKKDNKGDPIKREFVVTNRVLKGIQAMTDTYSCSPNFKYTSKMDSSGEQAIGGEYDTQGSYVSSLGETAISPNRSSGTADDLAESLDQKEVLYVVSWNEGTGILETSSTMIDV